MIFLPSEAINSIKVFRVGGRYVFKKMTWFDRNFIKVVAFFMKSKDIKRGMLTETEDVKRRNLDPLIGYICK